jgi:hypothetical protein
MKLAAEHLRARRRLNTVESVVKSQMTASQQSYIHTALSGTPDAPQPGSLRYEIIAKQCVVERAARARFLVEAQRLFNPDDQHEPSSRAAATAVAAWKWFGSIDTFSSHLSWLIGGVAVLAWQRLHLLTSILMSVGTTSHISSGSLSHTLR